MPHITKSHTSRRRYRQGQALVEYGLIIALIAVIIVGSLTLMGTGIATEFNRAATALEQSLGNNGNNGGGNNGGNNGGGKGNGK